jgi:hypothetical protein
MRCGKEKESAQQLAFCIQPKRLNRNGREGRKGTPLVARGHGGPIELTKLSSSSFALFASFAVNRLG